METKCVTAVNMSMKEPLGAADKTTVNVVLVLVSYTVLYIYLCAETLVWGASDSWMNRSFLLNRIVVGWIVL